MTQPVRLQLSRRKGFDLQALSCATNGLPAVNVARPSRFGNPFKIAACRDAGYRGDDACLAEKCTISFRAWIDTNNWRDHWMGEVSEAARARMRAAISELRGKNLACWCKPSEPCHADVLLEVANRPICEAA